MSSSRVLSIDIMRGLTLLLMLFVNDLNMDVAPAWLGHTQAFHDGMGLADWVFPGFLFIMGMAIPFAFANRIKKGSDKSDIIRHVLYRSVSLIVIGVLMLNTGRVNPELTGMSKSLWALLMYGAVFLIWNNYQDGDKSPFLLLGLRLLGLGILIMLVLKFRSGEPENDGSLIAGWWGILGLLGWGYLSAALVCLLFNQSLIKIIASGLFFLALNILSALNRLEFLNPLKPFLGVIIQGNVPLIVIAGLIAGILLKNYSGKGHRFVILSLVTSGTVCILAGMLLHKWFILSKILATPSWGMLCSGISFFVFTLIYIIADIYNNVEWASFFRPAGENSLTTYLVPDVIYYLIWMTGLNVLVYKESMNPWIVVSGSLAWAIIMIWLTELLKKAGISLKL